MKRSKKTAAANRGPGRPESDKRAPAGSRPNRAGGSRPPENARKRTPLGRSRAVVLLGGVAFAAMLAFGWLLSPAVTGQASTAQAFDPPTIGTIARVGERAPDAAFQTTKSSGSIAELRGKKTMVWLFSTWCGTCAQGVVGLAKAESELAHAGIQIVALRNYRNGGYPGPSVANFIGRFGSGLLDAPNWMFGEASHQLARRYNPKGYPDIYFLIDRSGVIRAVDSAPSFTIKKILRFAAKGA